jgi:2-iminoacetate synthase
MTHFAIDPGILAAQRAEATRRAARGEGKALADRLRAGEVLDDVCLATLLLARDVASDDLLDIARAHRPAGAPRIETFAPLYISNECDGECLMCGMRGNNGALKRETADASTTRDQLDVLHRRGIRGVAVLAGEYRHGAVRTTMLTRAAQAARDAIERGFTHVLINVGSLEDGEYEEFLAGIPRDDDGRISPHVTMCTFQETYDPQVYAKFMGSTPGNPRCDFGRRLENFDRAAQRGMRSANPGLLLGLNRDLAYEMLALCAHVRHLESLDLQVYISLPRLRKASGAVHRGGVSDGDLTRVVALLAARFADAKVVISTRETPEIQQRLLPVIGVLTAGSPGVAPYDDAGARFELEESQFEVADQRPFEVILGECLAIGATIDGYEPSPPKMPAPAS